ncbi:hypothetical protein OB925_12170 [Aeromonas rivipollensis]|uniref:hypothetical protein n=1 Tax=Aeromonas rivipollensis TaxID=948519 RepID=UPI00259F0249|nr:hypothetical protein [Aeromonas rivipollensis]MDM5085591.1 hypothetical protein [Aeromonas rivipollensis]MDM5097969.1 hypothetical protein [Aeromonas rivipollensis]MDM5106255.1 hypothetical protein [Aeromonas rivipollensis]
MEETVAAVRMEGMGVMEDMQGKGMVPMVAKGGTVAIQGKMEDMEDMEGMEEQVGMEGMVRTHQVGPAGKEGVDNDI